MVYFNANSVDTKFYTPARRCLHVNGKINRYFSDPQRNELDLRYRFGEPWCKLIRKSIIDSNGITFEETPIHNDTQFSYLLGYHAKRITADRRALYCVTERSGSTSKIETAEHLIVRAKVLNKANIFFKEHGIPVIHLYAMHPMKHFIRHGDIENYRICYKILKESGVRYPAFKMREYRIRYYILYFRRRLGQLF